MVEGGCGGAGAEDDASGDAGAYSDQQKGVCQQAGMRSAAQT